MNYSADFFKFGMYGVAYMEGIKYINVIEIGPVVIETGGIENGKLSVPVNNKLVRHTAFLAADTRPCVLIYGYISIHSQLQTCICAYFYTAIHVYVLHTCMHI